MSNADRSAFPIVTVSKGDGDWMQTYSMADGGLTKREYFAAKAMQGMWANQLLTKAYSQFSKGSELLEDIKVMVYKQADSMLEGQL